MFEESQRVDSLRVALCFGASVPYLVRGSEDALGKVQSCAGQE